MSDSHAALARVPSVGGRIIQFEKLKRLNMFRHYVRLVLDCGRELDISELVPDGAAVIEQDVEVAELAEPQPGWTTITISLGDDAYEAPELMPPGADPGLGMGGEELSDEQMAMVKTHGVCSVLSVFFAHRKFGDLPDYVTIQGGAAYLSGMGFRIDAGAFEVNASEKTWDNTGDDMWLMLRVPPAVADQLPGVDEVD